jgi:hypothetical protein
VRNLLYAATATSLLALAPVANAVPIVNFAQTSGLNTITGTASATGTTWGGTDIAVSISQIDAPAVTPLPAFLDVTSLSNTGATVVGGAVVQHFSGTFSLNSLANNTGTNYLSGTFSDAAITSIGSSQISVFASTANFTSGVITDLGLPRSIGFTLTNVTPIVSVTPCTITNNPGRRLYETNEETNTPIWDGFSD